MGQSETGLNSRKIEAFAESLREQERSEATVKKYLHDVREFWLWLGGREVSKATTIDYKQLLGEQYKIATANVKIAALNSFLSFCGWHNCRVCAFRVQRRMFRDRSRDLSQQDYHKLIEAANLNRDERLMLVMETICSTGIRVSELPHITLEAVRAGQAQVYNKGKCRIILLPEKLRRRLREYARQQGIVKGTLFVTKNGTALDRSNIWRAMKRLCDAFGIDPHKVFPHNLRHLFAVTYYRQHKDIMRLADILGHSSTETTRIYLMTSGKEHRRDLDRMQLVI